MTDSGESDIEPGDVAEAWAVMRAAEFAASSDELAIVATWEAMRLMLVSPDEDLRDRGRAGLHGLVQGMVESLREHDPEGLERLVEEWRPTAEGYGLEW